MSVIDTSGADTRIFKYTNRTSFTVKDRIFMEPPNEMTKTPAVYLVFECEPGETIEIPARYARAIHDVRDGVLVGGLAPMLERTDPPQDYRMEECLLPTVNVPRKMLTPDEVADRLSALERQAPAEGDELAERLLTKPKGKAAETVKALRRDVRNLEDDARDRKEPA